MGQAGRRGVAAVSSEVLAGCLDGGVSMSPRPAAERGWEGGREEGPGEGKAWG